MSNKDSLYEDNEEDFIEEPDDFHEEDEEDKEEEDEENEEDEEEEDEDPDEYIDSDASDIESENSNVYNSDGSDELELQSRATKKNSTDPSLRTKSAINIDSLLENPTAADIKSAINNTSYKPISTTSVASTGTLTNRNATITVNANFNPVSIQSSTSTGVSLKKKTTFVLKTTSSSNVNSISSTLGGLSIGSNITTTSSNFGMNKPIGHTSISNNLGIKPVLGLSFNSIEVKEDPKIGLPINNSDTTGKLQPLIKNKSSVKGIAQPIASGLGLNKLGTVSSPLKITTPQNSINLAAVQATFNVVSWLPPMMIIPNDLRPPFPDMVGASSIN